MDACTSQFYSHGKLLFTGEYLVMYGARALAVPIKLGQSLKVHPWETGYLKWEAFVENETWFSVSFDLPSLEVIQTNDDPKAAFLKTVLLSAKKINPDFLNANTGYNVTTNLNYPQEWGLGSSSTFISNLAWWANVDPMQLHQLVSNGSGYDIACARSASPIVFTTKDEKPEWSPVNFYPSFADHLYFLFLGQKQDTAGSVTVFRNKYQFCADHVNFIDELTHKLLVADTLEEAIFILNKHELFMSRILQIHPVKQKLFPDFNGTVKSLGAWGGDFILIASPLHFHQVKSYFRNKGYESLFKFGELVVNGPSSGSRII